MKPFLDRPFRVRDAVAAGIPRSAVDATRFEAPFHGIRSPWGTTDLLSRCRAYALKMRADAAFTSLTAAAIWGLPVAASADLTRLHVSVPHGRPRPRSRGVIGSERRADADVVLVGGLPVLAPTETWASLAGTVDIGELIVLGDHLVGDGREPGLVTLEALAEISQLRMRGAPLLRKAAPRVRIGSRSRPESWSRILLVESGIPEPCLNHYLAELGVYLDLAWPDARFGYEYQGGHHDDPVQRAADIVRQERVHDIGWMLMEVTKNQLFRTPEATVERVRARLAARGVESARTNPPIWAVPRP